MSHAVTFLWPPRNASAKRRAAAIAQITRAVERNGDAIVATFEAPPGASIEEASGRFRLALRFVQNPENAIGKLVVPSLDEVPNAVETLSELAVLVKKSRLVLAVVDLGVEASTAKEVEDLRDDHGSDAAWKQRQSERIKGGMRYAKELEGGAS